MTGRFKATGALCIHLFFCEFSPSILPKNCYAQTLIPPLMKFLRAYMRALHGNCFERCLEADLKQGDLCFLS